MERTLRTISFGAAGIGLLDSIYLTWIKLSNQEAFCAGIGQCDVVNASKYASIGGIPIALLGAGAYLAILLVLFWENEDNFIGENASMILFGLTFVGVLYSAYLTYIEVAVLYAICPYCVLSAVVMLVLFVVTLVRMFANADGAELAQE